MNRIKPAEGKRIIRKLIEHINDFLYKVRPYIAKEYIKFENCPLNPRLLLEDANFLYGEIEKIRDNVIAELNDELHVMGPDLLQCVDDLECAAVELLQNKFFLQIDNLMLDIDDCKTMECNYQRVQQLLRQINKMTSDAEEDLHDHNYFKSIKLRYNMEMDLLFMELETRFKQMVRMTEITLQRSRSVVVRIDKDENRLHQVIVCLLATRYDPRPVCLFLLRHVLLPIIERQVTVYIKNDDKDNSIVLNMILSFANTNRPYYRDVFQNIRMVFQCLGFMNIAVSEDVCMLGILADVIKTEFLSALRMHCLVYAVPNTIEDMAECTLVADLQELHEYLCQMLFLDDAKDVALTEFAKSVEAMFTERFCTNILVSSVRIMRLDLLDMIDGASVDCTKDEEIEAAASAAVANPTFSKCMISSSTMELVKLMNKVVLRAPTSTEVLAKRLLDTIPTIIQRYMTEVPRQHSTMLANMPQQAALFYNNCDYLAFWLTLSSTKEIVNVHELGKSIQQAGAEQFSQQVLSQRTVLMDMLNEFEIGTSLDPNMKKVILKCMKYFEMLRNVWQPLLTEEVYNQTIASVLSEVMNEIIKRILALRDIPPTVADGLVEVLGIVLTRSPSLFKNNPQFPLLVKSVTKMSQLQMILDSSIAQIVAQWSARVTEPLSINFKATEVKHLIRALFRNNGRRANALAQIV